MTQGSRSDSHRATFVKVPDWGTGAVKIYRLAPPLKWEAWSEDGEEERQTEFVAVSATVAPFTGAETYIFPCDENGDVSSWGELDGSYRGGLDHAVALRGAGYEVGRMTPSEKSATRRLRYLTMGCGAGAWGCGVALLAMGKLVALHRAMERYRKTRSTNGRAKRR